MAHGVRIRYATGRHRRNTGSDLGAPARHGRKGGTIKGKGRYLSGAAFAAALGVLAAFVPTGFAGAEGSSIIPLPLPIEWAFNTDFSPRALSKTTPTPIALKLSGQVKTADGTHPPALREVILETDRNGAIDVKGLPVCRLRPPEDSGTDWVREVCKNTIIGRGTMDIEVAFPESSPLLLKSPLTVFNRGVKQGVTTLLVHVFLKNPVSAAVVTVVKIKKTHKGRFGTKAIFSLPVIAGGSGSVTSFSATLYKRFSYKGKRVSLLTLKCPDGKVRTRAEAIFSDGAQTHAEVSRPCIPKE